MNQQQSDAFAARRAEADAEAISMCEEVCDRADALGLGLVAFMVADVRRVIAMAKAADPAWVATLESCREDLEAFLLSKGLHGEFVASLHGPRPACAVSRLSPAAASADSPQAPDPAQQTPSSRPVL